jgi:hypothetical protein
MAIPKSESKTSGVIGANFLKRGASRAKKDRSPEKQTPVSRLLPTSRGTAAKL